MEMGKTGKRIGLDRTEQDRVVYESPLSVCCNVNDRKVWVHQVHSFTNKISVFTQIHYTLTYIT
jgi:hypothetical protein